MPRLILIELSIACLEWASDSWSSSLVDLVPSQTVCEGRMYVLRCGWLCWRMLWYGDLSASNSGRNVHTHWFVIRRMTENPICSWGPITFLSFPTFPVMPKLHSSLLLRKHRMNAERGPFIQNDSAILRSPNENFPSYVWWLYLQSNIPFLCIFSLTYIRAWIIALPIEHNTLFFKRNFTLFEMYDEALTT